LPSASVISEIHCEPPEAVASLLAEYRDEL
jgi:hypothetical protein